jgi:exopolysaccharide production protein ExoY
MQFIQGSPQPLSQPSLQAPSQAVFDGPSAAFGAAPSFRAMLRGPAKRAIDLVGAAILLAIASPLLLLAGLLILLVDPGPVLYRHRRVGRNGTPFDCLKLRTMRGDSDARLEIHLAGCAEARAEWQATRKLRDDPRILGRLGRVLRRSSLDELPQLWNVMRGEMSLVGPRPIVEAELVYYQGFARWYLAARPGLTGPWQVGGRSDASYVTRVRLDVDYVRRPSLRRDLAIMVRTIPAVLRARGAC